LTKEPKLDRARRQVPEWEKYDNEVAAFQKRLNERTSTVSKSTASATSQEQTNTGELSADNLMDVLDSMGHENPLTFDEGTSRDEL
jgi:UDP-glucose:glycoprotein glucosyltransferase